jgi:hypothetical protein
LPAAGWSIDVHGSITSERRQRRSPLPRDASGVFNRIRADIG